MQVKFHSFNSIARILVNVEFHYNIKNLKDKNQDISKMLSFAEIDYNEHEKFSRVIHQAPNRNWIEQYLDLVQELLNFTGLEDSDPRLVLSIPQSGSQTHQLSVTINRRYVLTAFRYGKPVTGFIVPFDFEQLAELRASSVHWWKFEALPGEQEGETPYFIRCEGLPQEVLTSEQRRLWKKTVLSEVERCQASPYKRNHRKTFYKATVDLIYRDLLLNEAFPKNTQTALKEPNLSKVYVQVGPTELEIERQKFETEGYFNIENIEDARRRVTASIVQRQGQSEFRRKLLKAYNGRCPITGCDVELAIEAAHIIPYQGIETNHLTNGLPIRADIHTLFDLYLLSINPNHYEVVIASNLKGTCYEELEGRKLTLPLDENMWPDRKALTKHYEIFLENNKN